MPVGKRKTAGNVPAVSLFLLLAATRAYWHFGSPSLFAGASAVEPM